jgi:hypothetical protein
MASSFKNNFSRVRLTDEYFFNFKILNILTFIFFSMSVHVVHILKVVILNKLKKHEHEHRHRQGQGHRKQTLGMDVFVLMLMWNFVMLISSDNLYRLL